MFMAARGKAINKHLKITVWRGDHCSLK